MKWHGRTRSAIAARDSTFGGLVASGWHTAALTMRLLADSYLSSATSLGSPGIEALRWLEPVRPNDSLKVRISIIEARRSRSKPEQGIVRSFVETSNQHHKVVMDMTSTIFVRCRSVTPER